MLSERAKSQADPRVRDPKEISVCLPGGGALALDPVGHDECLPRKEVIQPHLPVRLPCYDFTPLTNHTFGVSLLKG